MNESLQAGEGRPIALYIKTALSSLTAMILAMFAPTFWISFRNISQEKQPDLPRSPAECSKTCSQGCS
jgi:hypothetical protein